MQVNGRLAPSVTPLLLFSNLPASVATGAGQLVAFLLGGHRSIERLLRVRERMVSLYDTGSIVLTLTTRGVSPQERWGMSYANKSRPLQKS